MPGSKALKVLQAGRWVARRYRYGHKSTVRLGISPSERSVKVPPDDSNHVVLIKHLT